METIHPVAAHFAVVLPLVALLLQVAAIILKNAVLTRTSTAVLLVATGMVALAYISGGDDAKNYVGEILSTYSEEGAVALKEHAGLGYNLMLAMIIVSIIKVVNCKLNKAFITYFTVAAMLAMSAGMMVQGKHGGELVYKHGTVFEAHAIKDTLNTAIEDAEEAEDDAEKAETYEDAIKEALGVEEEE